MSQKVDLVNEKHREYNEASWTLGAADMRHKMDRMAYEQYGCPENEKAYRESREAYEQAVTKESEAFIALTQAMSGE
jgi:hypothetical protein